MQLKEKVYKLKGKVFHYAWGGYAFLPALLGEDNSRLAPYAEYWLGAHALAPSELQTEQGAVPLSRLIAEDAVAALSQEVADRFGELPYLFKVQDVKDILSIQVHPSKQEAEKGFDREEALGIPRDAAHRNYKDRNHKPEMMVALSEFWLLHGFLPLAAIEKVLDETPEFNVLLPYFRKEGLQALYRLVMEMPQLDINFLLEDLVKREIRRKREGELTKEMPGWWVARLFETAPFTGEIDRAVFSIYLFNIVKVNPGEGVFQGAGIPHAYMEGQTMELMANSDNVLRGGLTPKHIDVPELLKQTSFQSIVPQIMKGEERLPGETLYPCPVADFGMARIRLTGGGQYSGQAASFEIIIVTEGGVLVNNSLVLKRGEAVAVLPGGEYTIDASGHALLFKAFIP
ncbi:mannose-6-phosphate isomerase, class I [Sediminibacterium soli]|uniref:mannose-6-phosphate isomerase, class I n=1 Tax=Sediminibacterium soli TaxID=2698829 RepID=UPI00137A50B4|nr:mannose-6-phosphate isomerase, class I [Sediminibacterium soli]NCI46003.1 mannose-6-phosphate isomerase, class I [Sediminibacterium soli]